MTVTGWILVGVLVATAALTGLGFLAFWPAYPSVNARPPRPDPNPAHPAYPAPAVDYPEPGPDEMVWSTDAAKRFRPRHRHEDIQEGTQRLRWHEVPSGPQPIHPPAPPVE